MGGGDVAAVATSCRDRWRGRGLAMGLLDSARRRLGVVLVAGVLLPAGVVTATAAQAAPSTKYYTATVSPQQVDSGVSQQAFTLTLSNCGPSSGCTKASQQTLGSANI